MLNEDTAYQHGNFSLNHLVPMKINQAKMERYSKPLLLEGDVCTINCKT